MTSRQDWPKPDLLQQRRLELGLPPEPIAPELLPRLLLKGAVLGVVLLVISIAFMLFFAHQKRRFEAEVMALAPVEARVGNAEARLKTMGTKRAVLQQQTQQIAPPQISAIEASLSEICALELGPLKIGVPQVGVHKIHIRKAAVRAIPLLQQLD